VGHLEAGAALAGIIKAIECLERGKIPPQNHFIEPNSKIDFTNIHIPTALLPWPKTSGGPRRAAVNSFGFGGTNGHIVLEHWPMDEVYSMAVKTPYVFKISAMSEVSLHKLGRKYAEYVSLFKPNLRMLAHTTLMRRSTLARTQYIIATTHDELLEKLSRSTSNLIWNKPSLCEPLGFIFTGQGAQWSVKPRYTYIR